MGIRRGFALRENGNMYRKIMNALQMLNILMQSLYTLLLPIGIGALLSFLLTRYASAPKWIWAILLTVGTLMGLYSMVKYLLTAIAGQERFQKQREEADAEKRAKEEMQARLNAELNNNEGREDD